MKIEIEITGQRIADLMTTAIEGGDSVTTAARGGWCSRIELNTGIASTHPWYADEKLWDSPFFLVIVTEVNDETTGHEIEHLISYTKIRDRLTVMAEKYPITFSDIFSGSVDASTADTFLQFIVFGEEKYG